MAPHPFFENRRQSSQKSIDDENINIKGAFAVAEANSLPRPSSLDSLLGYSNWTGDVVFGQQVNEPPYPVGTEPNANEDYGKEHGQLPTIQHPTNMADVQEMAVPLRQWIANDIRERGSSINVDQSHQMTLQKASTLRKVTISYAISKLMQHVSRYSEVKQSSEQFGQLCSIDNFQVRNGQSDLGWEVMGVEMINPSLRLQIIIEDYSSDFFDVANENRDEFSGRKVSAVIYSASENTDHAEDVTAVKNETMLCHFVGILLHGLFAEGTPKRGLPKDDRDYENGPFAKKQSLLSGNNFSRATSISRTDTDENHGEGQAQVELFQPLSYLGYSSSLSQVVANLIDCGLGLFRPCDSYPCLEMAILDLCLLLEEPGRFLFDDFLKGGKPVISIGKGNGRLYGRTKEAHLITDTFCRVASTGESEAILVGGFSGCGKTRLVQSVYEAVEAAGGYVICQKFDGAVSAMSPLSVVISAFNDLCFLIAKRSTMQELHNIHQSLLDEFGINFQALCRLLPNVISMISSFAPVPTSNIATDNVSNYSSLCYTIQRFMRVVSSTRPVFFFLDDLQWGDDASLRLIHAVLSDRKGESCMLFVGSHRDNEAVHPITVFDNMLSQLNIPTSKMRLDGLIEDDVNSMISDALSILPRLSKPLARVVCRKTNGNPYFVLEFLRSLLDLEKVQFSLRDRRWIWDDTKVGEENITENVLHLLSNKLNGLCDGIQIALKVASCFGSQVDKVIVQKLSDRGQCTNLLSDLDINAEECCAEWNNSQYANLVTDIERAVECGFMDADESHYRFVHDKVREASYNMITGCKDLFHFELGMNMMHSCCATKDNREVLLEQINRGVPSMVSGTSHQNVIAELNYEASCEMTSCSNFTSALKYTKAAVSLLPDDRWATHYAVSLKYLMQLANAALACGDIDAAQRSLNEIISNGKNLDDRLDAFFLIAAIPSRESVDICIHVLRLLGEELPEGEGSVKMCTIITEVNKTKEMFQCFDEELLCTGNLEPDSRIQHTMKFYGRLGVLSWLVAADMHQFYMARFAQFLLKKSEVGYKCVPIALIAFGTCLCNGLSNDTIIGHRIGKIGMRLLNQSELDMADLSLVYLSYYQNLGLLFEPIQACIDMHRRGFELGMQVGNRVLACHHLCYVVHREIISGTNLQAIKSEIEFYLKLAKLYSVPVIESTMQIYYKNVLTLIGEQSHVQQSQLESSHEEIVLLQEMMSALFRGHIERAQNLSKKWEVISKKNVLKVPIRVISGAFYCGLAMTKMYRTKRLKSKPPLNSVREKWLPVLSKAEECSQWNFKSKSSILKAEYFSLTGNKENAELEYNVAISSAQSAKFTHEEGMACELAGLHYKYHGNHVKALDLFCQAKKCYEKWGSQMKVDQMTHQMGLITL